MTKPIAPKRVVRVVPPQEKVDELIEQMAEIESAQVETKRLLQSVIDLLSALQRDLVKTKEQIASLAR